MLLRLNIYKIDLYIYKTGSGSVLTCVVCASGQNSADRYERDT